MLVKMIHVAEVLCLYVYVHVGTLAQLQALQEEQDVEDETGAVRREENETGEEGVCSVTCQEMVNMITGE